ncbi:EutN/CcmL family microcompartment protein [Inediibacterium massiliense]|uniref:EutN/CcmL family microcompartment protein n=1 Tax=Inediibacterium massiliense TaxID=1658111 RepID=UPI0006B4F788|nr:EutN/CcmL family microcompartment protein [Inediibacterium massiliense]
MIIGKVVGNVWATKKEEGLEGLKLLVIQPIDYCTKQTMPTFVAVDSVGAGISDIVLVVRGSSARYAANRSDAPIDSTVVGIVDEVEVDKN